MPDGRMPLAPAPDLSVEIGGLRLENPVMPASGTFGDELGDVFDLDRLGAFVTKSVQTSLRLGNPLPRLCEAPAGIINSIGLPSRGVPAFIAEVIPKYRGLKPPLVVSVSANTVAEFAEGAALLGVPGVAAIEANISCPNLEEDGRAFAMAPGPTEAAIRAMRRATRLPIWAKLTPNTGDIAAVARAAEAAGADALVVANTILALAIDIRTRRPRLGNLTGGLSGPAVKPIVLRLVHQCARAVRIPVIGCGGIATGDDAVEYLLAGAAAVQVGTATFVRPTAMLEVIEGIRRYCIEEKVGAVRELVGALEAGAAPLAAMAPAE